MGTDPLATAAATVCRCRLSVSAYVGVAWALPPPATDAASACRCRLSVSAYVGVAWALTPLLLLLLLPVGAG